MRPVLACWLAFFIAWFLVYCSIFAAFVLLADLFDWPRVPAPPCICPPNAYCDCRIATLSGVTSTFSSALGLRFLVSGFVVALLMLGLKSRKTRRTLTVSAAIASFGFFIFSVGHFFKDELGTESHTEADQVTADRQGTTSYPLEFLIYTQLVREKIKGMWSWPDKEAALTASVHLEIESDGTIKNVRLVQGSGDPDFDQSVLAVTTKASPLPPPPPTLYERYFKELRITFDPRENK
jgi:TonB family protein